MMISLPIRLLGLFLLGVTSSHADTNQWQEIKSLYDGGKYEEALATLQKTEQRDAHDFYNSGVLHYRLGHLGIAVAYFEKANRLKAHDPDIQHNLKLARTGLEQLIGKERLDPASSWVESLADQVPLDEIRGFLGLLTFAFTLIWIRSYLKKRSVRGVILQPSGIMALLAIGITVALYWAQRTSDESPPAACLTQVAVRSGPGDQFLELSRIEAGTKVRLEGPVSEQWRQVRYSADGIGWIRESSLLLL